MSSSCFTEAKALAGKNLVSCGFRKARLCGAVKTINTAAKSAGTDLTNSLKGMESEARNVSLEQKSLSPKASENRLRFYLLHKSILPHRIAALAHSHGVARVCGNRSIKPGTGIMVLFIAKSRDHKTMKLYNSVISNPSACNTSKSRSRLSPKAHISGAGDVVLRNTSR